MDIFTYKFMQIALVVSIVVGILLPIVGRTIVFKRLSMIGDALAHTSLAGVAAGLIIGINPVIGAMVVCLIAALGIEFIRKKFNKFADISLAIVLAIGFSIALVINGYYKGMQSFEKYMFGSILSLSTNDLFWFIPTALVVSIICLLLYKELFLISLDETMARMSGVRVEIVNFIFTIIMAVAVAISVKSVGALLVSALMTMPVANSMIATKKYSHITIYSILFGVGYSFLGVILSFYIGKAPTSAVIVLVGAISLIITLVIKITFLKIKKKQQGLNKDKKNK